MMKHIHKQQTEDILHSGLKKKKKQLAKQQNVKLKLKPAGTFSKIGF